MTEDTCKSNFAARSSHGSNEHEMSEAVNWL